MGFLHLCDLGILEGVRCRTALQDDAEDREAPGKDAKGEVEDAEAPDQADEKAAGKAEVGEEARPAEVRPNMRLTSRKKVQTMQKNLMWLYQELSPTLSEDQRKNLMNMYQKINCKKGNRKLN